ncbi:MAG TPA: type II toxin-antitoxin system VapB family antitoxin [Longimicrobiaceae bacterium]|nr:type II toxin-antitoxin system VapB family antitoxin [Longimicrobiaceae bacterium]
MALNIKNPEADRLARQLAQATGESLTEAVLNALRERLVRETGRKDEQLLERIREIQKRFSELPVLDPRTPDEIIGYDEYGLPT